MKHSLGYHFKNENCINNDLIHHISQWELSSVVSECWQRISGIGHSLENSGSTEDAAASSHTVHGSHIPVY